jgi:ubiquinone/menaquinone biosynthesis C-methylase UbiE
MAFWLNKQANHLFIRMLLVLKPEVFFDRLNQLPWYKTLLRQWVDDNKFASATRVLEVGCATGSLTGYLSDSAYIATGVDASIKMIECAKLQSAGIDFLEASVENLPFDDGVFDAVISASLINILDDKESALKEMTRVCKLGGTVSILVPSQAFTESDFSLLNDSLALEGFSAASLEKWNKLPPKMTIEGVKHLLEKAGLTPQEPVSYLKGMVFSISAQK